MHVDKLIPPKQGHGSPVSKGTCVPLLQGLSDADVAAVSLEPSLYLLVQEPELHQEDEAGHTEEHVGP